MNYTVVKSEKQYNQYCDRVAELARLESTPAIEDEMELVYLLIDDWERKKSARLELDPIMLLKSLMENHQMKQVDLVKLLGLNKSTISLILNYKKGLSKSVIRKLATHFKLAQEAFNRPYELVTTEPKKARKNLLQGRGPQKLRPGIV